MVKKIEDGGPAFPLNNGRQEGMSLRDYFAGQALSGLCAHAGFPMDVEELAGEAYELADAMITRKEQS